MKTNLFSFPTSHLDAKGGATVFLSFEHLPYVLRDFALKCAR